jgi:hypothetical protein
MSDVRIDEEALLQMENAGSYMWSLIGYCDGRQGRPRAKVKRKLQLAYNRGYADGRAVRDG